MASIPTTPADPQLSSSVKSFGLTVFHRLPVFLFCLVAMFGLCSCRYGPGDDRLAVDLKNNLDRSFAVGLFDIKEFRRLGSYWNDLGRLVVYYDARLVFRRDYSLSDWNRLGLDALINVLGAGSRGVSGVKPSGNVKGDELVVHGTLLYDTTPAGGGSGRRWTCRMGLPSRTMVAAGGDGVGGILHSQFTQIEKLLGDISAMAREALNERDSQAVEQIHTFVRITRNRLAKRTAKKTRTGLVVATGHVGGTYYPLGKAFAEMLTRAGMDCKPQQTEGSVENCRMMQNGYVDFAVCQNDIAFQAHNGTGEFACSGPFDELTSLCSWFPEPVQVFVKYDSGIAGLEALKGRAIAVGQGASGTRINAREVFGACGFSGDDLASVVEVPPAAGFELLARGKVDAVFLTEAAPANSPRLLAGKCRLRLLSLPARSVTDLQKRFPFFVPLVIPEHTYPDQDEAVSTVAVTAMLMAAKGLSNDLVIKALEAHYSHLSDFIAAHPKGAAISLKHALDGLSIPQHPGAVEFFSRLKRHSGASETTTRTSVSRGGEQGR